jgi:hypothetical protein
MSGDPQVVRIGTGAAGDEDYTCPSFAAVKARPGIQPQAPARFPRPKLETFALGPVMTALDGIEFDGITVDKALDGLRDAERQPHPGLLQFAQHAVRCYLLGAEPSQEVNLKPLRDFWVVQRVRGQTWELYAWGRRYQSPNGRLREFRFLRFGEAGLRQRDPAQVAIAAYSTAFGAPAPWPDWWSQPFMLRGGEVVERVRVVEVGLLDGSRVVLFDGGPAQAEGYFAEHGRERVARIAAGGTPVPGMSCASCKQLTLCEELRRLPGLLGLDADRAPLRTVSVSDLRYYQSCPAQAHLSSLNLPPSRRDSPEAELGRAVHSWLETAHRGGTTACGIADMPRHDDDLAGGPWGLTGETAQLGVRMLAHHPEVCAFQDLDSITEVRVEPRLVFHDTAANAIVIARPDMLYLQDGSWVWRETKTTQKPRWFHDDLLDEFPQLALAAVLLADGALGGDPAGSRVELEVLRPGAADIPMIDPTDPAQVTKARSVLQQLAQPWRDDEAFEARPGKACQWCRVSQWCPSFPGEDDLDGEGDP